MSPSPPLFECQLRPWLYVWSLLFFLYEGRALNMMNCNILFLINVILFFINFILLLINFIILLCASNLMFIFISYLICLTIDYLMTTMTVVILIEWIKTIKWMNNKMNHNSKIPAHHILGFFSFQVDSCFFSRVIYVFSCIQKRVVHVFFRGLHMNLNKTRIK